MKFGLLLFSTLALLSSQSAHASRGRLIALGEDKEDGSFYILDYRNIFHNPAYINEFRGFANLELGGAGSTAGLDTDDNQKAQGGVMFGAGDFTWGLQFGNESDLS